MLVPIAIIGRLVPSRPSPASPSWVMCSNCGPTASRPCGQEMESEQSQGSLSTLWTWYRSLPMLAVWTTMMRIAHMMGPRSDDCPECGSPDTMQVVSRSPLERTTYLCEDCRKVWEQVVPEPVWEGWDD